MFFPKKMLQCDVIIKKEKLSETIHTVGKMGIFHIDRSNRSLFFANLQNKTHSLITKTQKYLDILGIESRDIHDEIFEDFESKIDFMDHALKDMGIEIERLSNEKDALQKEQTKLNLAAKINSSFKEINIENLLKLNHINMCICLVPEELLETLSYLFEDINAFFEYDKFDKGSISMAVFYDPDNEDEIFTLLTKFEADIIENIYFSKKRFEEFIKEKSLLKEEFQKAKEKHGEELLSYNAKLVYIYKILSMKSSLIHKDDHYILKGWIPASKQKYFENSLKNVELGFHEVRGEAPVLLTTPKLFKPFEELIENFSYPSYTELNPTILFAFTFLIMFGMMFGDVGHGGVLAFMGFTILKTSNKYKLLGKVLVSSGISAVLFGFLYGSFFGFHHLIPHLLFAPMENIDNILYFSLIIGISIISLSMVLNIFLKLRTNDYHRIIFGSSGILWLLLYWFFIGIIIKAVLFELPVKYEIYIASTILFILFIMFLYKSKNLVKSILETSMEVMEYATNTVSFIRLGAFTLSHAALFLALFSITDIITKNQNEGVSYWLSIIIGNVIIIVLEGIVVTIQTLRLEYYEFFKRFYKGGGEKYAPFDLEKNDEKINEI